MTKNTNNPDCPYCKAQDTIKNGKKANDNQNYQCKSCQKQFQARYKNEGADPKISRLIKATLLNKGGIRSTAKIFSVSIECVLANFRKLKVEKEWKPMKKKYKELQIDELWTWVWWKGSVHWLIYAYAPENGEIVAWQWGERDNKTVKKLYKKLKDLEVERFCTDGLKAFASVLKKTNHLIGKQYTRHIEGINCWIRTVNARLVRKTTCFSKLWDNHQILMEALIWRRNLYHTF